MITVMFTCTLSVATRQSRGLSSWRVIEESNEHACEALDPLLFPHDLVHGPTLRQLRSVLALILNLLAGC